MQRWVWPAFLNLGVAKRIPMGATGLAPRAALLPPASIHDPFVRRTSATSPLLLTSYALPVKPAWTMGPTPPPVWTSQLLPNPYAPQG